MAAVFKYIKKAIVTITKGPRKGTRELRYFYKGDKIPKSLQTLAATKLAAKAAHRKAVTRLVAKMERGGLISSGESSAAAVKKAMDVMAARATLKRAEAGLKKTYARSKNIKGGTSDHALWVREIATRERNVVDLAKRAKLP